jgi:ribose/xylose/arabinose/galactoside ABC-type transport system permease subunit
MGLGGETMADATQTQSTLSPAIWRAGLSLLFFAGLMLVIFTYSPNFFRVGNLVNVLVQTAMLAILATGMTVVMVGGGIDLSLPANMALSGILGSMVMVATGGIMSGCLVMVATGVLIGALNGIAVAYLRMIPFVVTLAMMSVCGGLSVWITNSVSISDQPGAFYDLVLSRPLGVPAPILVMLGVVVFGQVVMGQSRFGRELYAIGTNAVAARISRVPVQRTLFLSYALAGLMAGIAAIVITARLGSASANIGNDSVILDVVTACVIGGVSIYGGVGRPLGALFGALFVLVLGNVLNLIGISFFVGLMLKGAVIIALVALDRATGAAR